MKPYLFVGVVTLIISGYLQAVQAAPSVSPLLIGCSIDESGE